MKILLTMNVPYFPAHGGANKANRYLCEGLARKGHSVTVVVPALGTPSRLTHARLLEELSSLGIGVESGARAEVFEVDGVIVHAVKEASDLRAHLVEQIESVKPDWVMVSSEDPSQTLLSAALKLCPRRVVYLAHSPSFFPFGPWAFFPSRARTELFRQVAAIIAVSEFVADYLRRWADLESTVIYWPAYGEGPFPELGAFDNRYVTMVNPCAVKGISILLELARQLPWVQFAAVPTWGTTDADLKALAQLSNIKLLPAADEINEILAETRLLLVPSLWGEAFGLIVVEAMLRGVPVMASASGGTVEAKLGTDYVLPVRQVERFTERLDGNMVPSPVIPPQEIGPWVEALSALVMNRALYDEQSRAARNAALKFVAGLDVAPFEELLDRLTVQTKQEDAGVRPESSEARTQRAPDGERPNRIAELTPEQRALLVRRLRNKATPQAAVTEAPELRRASREDNLPLSFAQQRLWFVDQLEQSGATYNISGAVRLTGALNSVALKQSLSEIVRRHEILRTTFNTREGQAVQVIAPPQDFALPLVDLESLSRAEAEATARRLASEEMMRPFILSQGPLLRARLLRLQEDEHVLLLTMHHIVSDGWSLGVFVRELTSLYGAFSGGEQSSLAELKIQYGDFADWQRRWLQGEVFEQQLSYWKQQLSGAPEVLALPSDRPRPAMQSFNGALQFFALSGELSEAVRQLSRREGVTPFMLLLAAFQILLHRYTGVEDCVVGTNIANRNRADIESLIGLFANNLVLRTDLSGDPTFRQLLARVRETALGAYAHQDFPFEKLVEAIRPGRDLSRSPLVQVLFVLQNAPSLELELAGLKITSLETECRIAKFDLTLFMEDDAGAMRGSVEYNTDLFNASTITRLLGHFQHLLQDITANPERNLSSFSLAESPERSGGGFNDDLEDY